jgi:glycosyltransferase involved in cell wall biosynthesis
MSAPLFSVITVCLDAKAHLAETLDSVLAQSFKDFEYVIADGGSTDGTVELLRAYGPRFDGRMKCVSEPDDGLFDAMNKALARASGEYVVYLGADDRLRPGALDTVSRSLAAATPPDIVCGGAHVFGPDASWDERASRKVRRGLPQRAPARHQSIFVRRTALSAIGGFDVRFPIASDYEAYLRLIESGCSESLIDETLSDFRLGGVSSTNALATARGYREVRVLHGADPVIETLVMWKSALAATLFALWKRPM